MFQKTKENFSTDISEKVASLVFWLPFLALYFTLSRTLPCKPGDTKLQHTLYMCVCVWARFCLSLNIAVLYICSVWSWKRRLFILVSIQASCFILHFQNKFIRRRNEAHDRITCCFVSKKIFSYRIVMFRHNIVYWITTRLLIVKFWWVRNIYIIYIYIMVTFWMTGGGGLKCFYISMNFYIIFILV